VNHPVTGEPLSVGDFAYHVPNGVWIPGSPAMTARIMQSLKAQGLKPGVSDIVIPLRTKLGHPGAYIELKREKGSKTSEEQLWWLQLMEAQGYFAGLARGIAEAEEMICNLYGGVVQSKR
jgi:hypothetical protein